MRLLPVIAGVDDVAARNLCAGCGACAYLQPDQVRMVDDLDLGRRPVIRAGSDTTEALAGCPGASLAHDDTHHPGVIGELRDGWGPVLAVWEGYAADPEIRFAGSSGGAATALALHALDDHGMHGVLHIAARPDIEYLNHTVMSRSRQEMLAATGSRYAPASPCDGLQMIADAPEPCVFIGKPCDVAATSKARRLRPELDAKLGLTIAIFCAGTPSTRGTLEMLDRMDVADPEQVRSLRYRGNGWPGAAVAQTSRGGGGPVHEMSYDQSWGEILQKHVQWRCRVCVDHTGEFADIAVGDPWYREIGADEAGQSLILARTERGRQLLEAAVKAGALAARRVDPGLLPASQPNLLATRGAVWGRIVTSRALGVAAPRYTNMPTGRIWWRELSALAKIRSISGTLKRIVRRRLHRRQVIRPVDEPQFR